VGFLLSSGKSTINHFYDKLLRLKGDVNTVTGRKMAFRRHKFMLIFLDEFFAEWGEKEGMTYILRKRLNPSYVQKSLSVFRFQTTNNDVEVYFVDVEKGHDTFIVSQKITHIYYVLEGAGYFIIDGYEYDATQGVLLEVPPGHEYSFSGIMKLLLMMTPPWFEGNDRVTKDNPDVLPTDRS
jgi:mannose-6-phosphate isomerase-like protein (cupin superfamily)